MLVKPLKAPLSGDKLRYLPTGRSESEVYSFPLTRIDMTSSRLINLENSPLVTTLPSGLRIRSRDYQRSDSGSLLITTPPPLLPSLRHRRYQRKVQTSSPRWCVFKFNGHNRCRQSARSWASRPISRTPAGISAPFRDYPILFYPGLITP